MNTSISRSGVQNRVFQLHITYQNSFKQGIFFGWQGITGGHFCINTKILGLFHPVNLIFTTKPRGHKRRSRSSITWSSATMLFRRKFYSHGAIHFNILYGFYKFANNNNTFYAYVRVYIPFVSMRSMILLFSVLHGIRISK